MPVDRPDDYLRFTTDPRGPIRITTATHKPDTTSRHLDSLMASYLAAGCRDYLAVYPSATKPGSGPGLRRLGLLEFLEHCETVEVQAAQARW